MNQHHRVICALAFLGSFAPLMAVFAQAPSDPNYRQEWYLERIGAEAAWNVATGGDVVVAVLDTGVDLHQPDLQENLWKNNKEIANNGIDDDRNGFIDDTNGWDFIGQDNDPNPIAIGGDDREAASHGTFVAGIIAATANNAIGYAGVLWKAKIMTLRVLDTAGTGDEATVGQAIDYAVKNGAKVINMSFSGVDPDPNLEAAMFRAYNAGVTIVAAMGNDSMNANDTPVYPACTVPGGVDPVIGVAATDQSDRQTSFTNYGSSCVDIAAPGVNFYNLAYINPSEGYTNSSEGPWDGTSFAAPVVSGVAALLKAKYPSLTPQQIMLALKLGVDPAIATTGVGAVGVGRVNVQKSLVVAKVYADSNPPVSADAGGKRVISFIARGANTGDRPEVQVFKADGSPYASFLAYGENFHGGVNVALADIDNDASPEVITGAGLGGGPHVRVFKPYGALVKEFFAYDGKSSQGVSVAVGDIDGNGQGEIVTAVGGGVSDDVVIWSVDGVQKGRFTVDAPSAQTRLRVTLADIDADGTKEIIVAAADGNPWVQIYKANGAKLVDFLTYNTSLASGIGVIPLDLDNDARDELIVLPSEKNQNHVRIFTRTGALWQETQDDGVIKNNQSSLSSEVLAQVIALGINIAVY